MLYRGLYIMLEVFGDGSAVLWVDLYSLVVKLSEQRPLSPSKARKLGLSDTYTSYIPTPIKRLELTNKLLGTLCEGSELRVVFADGYSVSLTCNFPIVGVMGDSKMSYGRLTAIYLLEPALQFYNGTHVSPRRIVSLKPFSYRNLLNTEIRIKLLTDNETLDLAKKLVNHLIKGYPTPSGELPPFSDVFRARLVF